MISNVKIIIGFDFVAWSAVDRWFEFQYGHIKDNDIGICCFPIKHAL
jgi:hypothetical protein